MLHPYITAARSIYTLTMTNGTDLKQLHASDEEEEDEGKGINNCRALN